MNFNLYLKELKYYRKSVTIWTSIVVLLTLLVMSIFPYMGEMIGAKGEMLESLPEGITKAMSLDTNSWSKILGLYNVYYSMYIIILMSIFTGSTGGNIITKEENDKTAEFLLTKPISRLQIFLTKIDSLFALMLIILGIQTLVAFIGVIKFGEENIDWNIFITMHLNGALLVAFFTCIGVLMSMLLPVKKSYMGLVVGVVFGSYFIDAISKVSDKISFLGYFSPYHYFNFDLFNPDYAVSIPKTFIMLLICAAILFVSYKLYNKKDINA